MKIVVTRSDGQAEELVARLEALGHDVVRCPLIRIDPRSLRASATGVFVGCNGLDYAARLASIPEDVEGMIATGNVASVLIDIVESSPRDERVQRVRDYVEVLTGRSEAST